KAPATQMPGAGVSYSAAGSGWAWTPLPWAIREAATNITSWGLAATKAMARTVDEMAAVDAAAEMLAGGCGRGRPTEGGGHQRTSPALSGWSDSLPTPRTFRDYDRVVNSSRGFSPAGGRARSGVPSLEARARRPRARRGRGTARRGTRKCGGQW